MSRFLEASRQAAGLLGGEWVSLSTWAEAVRRCDLLLEGREPAVRHAAAMVPLVTGMSPNPQRTVLLPGLLHDSGLPMSREERGQVRMVALFVTRAAARDATDPMLRSVLSGVERQVLEVRPPSSRCEAGLRGWAQAVASSSVAMDPALALAISGTQRALLRRGGELMEALEVTDGVGHERLWAAVQANGREWNRAYETWRELAPRHTAPLSDIGRGTVALSRATSGASAEDMLRGLLATGFGGSLTAALAVTPVEMRGESSVVATAAMLESRSDLASTVQTRTRAPQTAPSVSAPVSGRRPVRFSSSSVGVASPVKDQAEVVEIDRPRIEDHAALVELARRRDAGVIAEAARSGVAEAQALMAEATAEQVDGLIERGQQARRAIASSGVAAVLHWSKKIPPDLHHPRDEFIAQASLHVVELVDRWDQGRSRWGYYAYQETDYEFRNSNRRRVQAREVVSDRIGDYASGLERVIGPVSQSPEDLVLNAEEKVSVQAMIDTLPPRLRLVAQRRLDLTEPVSTLAEVAAEVGHSTTTVHKDDHQMKKILQERHRDSHRRPLDERGGEDRHGALLRPPTRPHRLEGPA